MGEEFKIEIVNPDKSFLSKEDVTEVVVPAFEGEMGILKDHISIISFLKPGVITVQAKSGEEKYFVEEYEPPLSTFLDMDTTNKTEEECVDEILNVYRQMATVA